MRIGYVVKRYPRFSETFIVNEILAHEAAGLDVRIFALLPPEDTHFQDIIARVRAPVTYLRARSSKTSEFWSTLLHAAKELPDVWKYLSAGPDETPREVLQALILALEIKKQGISHLHAHFATSATVVARLAASFAGISFTFTAHAKDIFLDDISLENLRQKFLSAALAVTVSDYNVIYLKEKLGISDTRIRRIYNGLDLERFSYSEPDLESSRIVAVGRLVEKKGFGILIDACNILRSRNVHFECRIVGTGPLQAELENQVKETGLEDQVILCGPRPQHEVIREIRNAALFVAPCIVGDDGNRDGLPTVLLETMALGTPCISTNVTGIPEVIHDKITGLVIEQGDAVGLADTLETLLGDKALRVRLAREARALIEEKFDIKRNAAELRECFAAACNDFSGKNPV